ncbi:E3 ubiquitin-protein ligase NRDP1-like [Adelges cooleyi]|uniref:E3 ubiquitin-protein ligase NRDP1-like n=1 Tax=Adelges cooleyi TaxID=133065 RepID=UPI00217FAC82|nr:E3 ubiquitin-protein ligase NRDP1-like [Adelges cooleyi]
MIWKIIFFLPCFNVVVCPRWWRSQSSSYARMQQEYPEPYRNFVSWLNDRAVTSVDMSTWDSVPSQTSKDTVREQLRLSRCPAADVGRLITNSDKNTWPTQIKSGQAPYYNAHYMTSMTFRQIPETSAVVAACSDNPTRGLPSPGILIFFF